eukprot:6207401-Pleurochrysis_carterae.AAC.1
MPRRLPPTSTIISFAQQTHKTILLLGLVSGQQGTTGKMSRTVYGIPPKRSLACPLFLTHPDTPELVPKRAATSLGIRGRRGQQPTQNYFDAYIW